MLKGRMVVAELPNAGLILRILVLFGLRALYRIEGESMFPIIMEGAQVVVDEGASVTVGDIVVARHPFKTSLEMAKRITGIDANGKYFLVGDNSDESTDSRTFGPVSIECIKGKVVARYR